MLKKSQVLREGRRKGLEDALRIINGMLTENGNGYVNRLGRRYLLDQSYWAFEDDREAAIDGEGYDEWLKRTREDFHKRYARFLNKSFYDLFVFVPNFKGSLIHRASVGDIIENPPFGINTKGRILNVFFTRNGDLVVMYDDGRGGPIALHILAVDDEATESDYERLVSSSLWANDIPDGCRAFLKSLKGDLYDSLD